jgi:hypothetical protein
VDLSEDDSDLFGVDDACRANIAESTCNKGGLEREGCHRRYFMSPNEAADIDTQMREGRIPPTGGPPIHLRQKRYPHHHLPYTTCLDPEERWLHLLTRLHRIRRLQRIWHNVGIFLRDDVSADIRKHLSRLRVA